MLKVIQIKLQDLVITRVNKDIMQTLAKFLLFHFLLSVAMNAYANTDLSFMEKGDSYTDARKTLLEKGWKPIKNLNIGNSSLYAQDIYDQGLVEVVDCISMELDACVFRFAKKSQVLEVKTITRQLTLESFKTYKKS